MRLSQLTQLLGSRNIGTALVALGALLLTAGLGADLLGVGDQSSVFGWRQIAATALGSAALLGGLLALALSGSLRAGGQALLGRLGLRGDRGRRAAALAALAAILLVAGAARFQGAYSGLPYLHVWDEPQIGHSAIQLLKRGEFNPQFFSYGSLLIYANMGVDALHFAYKMAQPDEADPVRRLRDVETGPFGVWPGAGDYRWYISHPSFYLWNRWLTALLGVGTVALTYVIAARAYNRVAGLVAAVFLAGLPYHAFFLSGRITNDLPSAFFMLLCLALTLAYLERRRTWLILLAAASVGLAMGTKYNAAYSLALPLVGLAVAAARWPVRPRPWLWAAVPLAAGAAFVASTPYALLSPAAFISGASSEIYHYMVDGDQETGTGIPGLSHLSLQLANLIVNARLYGLLFGLAGLPLLLRSTAGRLCLLLGLLCLIVSARTTVTFHRNLTVIYPVVAVAVGCLAASVLAWLWRPTSLRWRRAAGYGGAAVVVAVCALSLAQVSITGARLKATAETRSAAVGRLNELLAQRGLAGGSVGVATDLHIHPIDLRRIDHDVYVRQQPARQLICQPGTNDLLVLPAGPRDAAVAGYLATVEQGERLIARVGTAPLPAAGPIINPAVAIVAPLPYAPDWCAEEIRLGDLSAGDVALVETEGGPVISLGRSQELRTPFYRLAAGDYVAHVQADGDALLSVDLISRRDGEVVPLAEPWLISLDPVTQRYSLLFTLDDDAEVGVRIGYAEGEPIFDGQELLPAALAELGLRPAAPPVEREPLPVASEAAIGQLASVAAAAPCAEQAAFAPADAVTQETIVRPDADWLQLRLRGTLETPPCLMAAGQQGMLWQARGAGLMRVSVLAWPAGAPGPETIEARVVMLHAGQRSWYEIVELPEPTVVTLRLEWLDTVGAPEEARRQAEVRAGVAIGSYQQLTFSDAVVRVWHGFVADVRGLGAMWRQ